MKPLNKKQLQLALTNVGDMALKARIIQIINFLDVKPKDKILDCGCGQGFLLKILHYLYPKTEFWGIDKKEEEVKKAKTEVQKLPILQADIYRNNLPRYYFDKIILSEVLEHLPNDLKGLQMAGKLLKRKGLIVITVPNKNYPYLWDPINKTLEKLFNCHIKQGFFAGIWNMHLRLYQIKDLQKIIEKSGFKITEIKFLTHHCLPFNHLLLYAGKQLLNRRLLPKKMANSSDKFRWKESNQSSSSFVNFIYNVFNYIDSFNKQSFSSLESTVSICVRARKK